MCKNKFIQNINDTLVRNKDSKFKKSMRKKIKFEGIKSKIRLETKVRERKKMHQHYLRKNATNKRIE